MPQSAEWSVRRGADSWREAKRPSPQLSPTMKPLGERECLWRRDLRRARVPMLPNAIARAAGIGTLPSRRRVAAVQNVYVRRYRAAIIERRRRQHALVIVTLELVEALPMLRELFRAEDETAHPHAALIERQRRISLVCTPAFRPQRADDRRGLPAAADLLEQMRVGVAGLQTSVDEQSLDHSFHLTEADACRACPIQDP